MNDSVKSAISAVLVTLVAISVHAQVNQENRSDTGFRPAGTYALSEIESVNVANGNVTLAIPLGALPATPSGLAVGVQLTYNSALYVVKGDKFNNDTVAGWRIMPNEYGSGWRFSYDYGIVVDAPEAIGSVCTFGARTRLRMPDGSYKPLRLLNHNELPSLAGFYEYFPTGLPARSCATGTQQIPGPEPVKWFTTDGSYIRVEFTASAEPQWWTVPWTIYFPDGTKAYGRDQATEWIEDRNGVRVTINRTVQNGQTSISFQDPFGRTMVLDHPVAPGSYLAGASTVTYPGYQDYVITTIPWSQHTSGGFNFIPYENGPVLPAIFSTWGPDTITLPGGSAFAPVAGRQYKLSYWTDGQTSGELKEIETPSGAKAKYTYEFPSTHSLWTLPFYRNRIKSKELRYTPAFESERTERVHYSFEDIDSGSSKTTVCDSGVDLLTECTEVNSGKARRTEYFYFSPFGPDPKSGLVYKTVQKLDWSTIDNTVERQWLQNKPLSTPSTDPANPYVRTEVITRGGAWAGTRNTLDKNGNLVRREETDWRRDALIRVGGFITEVTDPFTRMSEYSYAANVQQATAEPTVNADAYWQATFRNLRSRKSEKTWGTDPNNSPNIPTIQGFTEYSYLENNVDTAKDRGNLTMQRAWDSTKGALVTPLTVDRCIDIRTEYNLVGNITKVTDPRGFEAITTYDATSLYPTLRCEACGRSEQRQTRFGHVTPNQWRSGLLTQVEDVDNGVKTDYEYDAIGRLTKTTEAKGSTGLERQNGTFYDDASRTVTRWQDRLSPGDLAIGSTERYDSLGRMEERIDHEVGPGLHVRRRYLKEAGRERELISAPYRLSGTETYPMAAILDNDSTVGWTEVTKDSAGRIKSVERFQRKALPPGWPQWSGSTAPPPQYAAVSLGTAVYSYSENTVNMKDELASPPGASSGVNRTMEYDPRGQLIGAAETDSLATTYQYNGLGQLARVTQGSQVRRFIYSSLSRLVETTQPESGTTKYSYDVAGNLIKREEERAAGTWVTTSWAPYDGLNRPTSKSYQGVSPATAAVSYEYDRGGLKGALSGVSSSDATIAYQYDKLGRVRSKVQVTSFGTTTAATNRVAHAMSFQYDLADNPTQMTLPSGRTITYSRDTIGRLLGISGTLNQTPRTYLSGVQYSAWSRPGSLSYGNGLTEGRTYDSRGWVSGITTAPLTLTPGWYPNGNLNSQRIQAGTTLDVTQTYDYYRPGRLKTAAETNTAAPGIQRWSQTFAYDGVGNRSITANSFPLQGNQPTTFDPATNAPSGGNWIYNKAGLMLRDGSGSEHEYDGEGRLQRFGLAANGTYYTYDGEGRRVMKYESSSGQRTIYVYDAEGELVAEYRTDTVDPSCGAAGAPGCTQFLMADHLGSTRVVTGLNQGVLGRYDYLPFGDEVPGWTRPELSTNGYGANLKMGVKFTGQMRDGESGLDYFGARYYSGAQGRFLSPDPENAGAAVEMPQSWHGYAYVMNNPMAYVDPSGLEADAPDGSGRGLCPLDEQTGKEQPCLAGLWYERLLREWRDYWRHKKEEMERADQDFRAGKEVPILQGTVLIPTGQLHHAISRKVFAALQRHPVLRNVYQARDPRLVTRARDLASHKGYQRWHRAHENEVIEWIAEKITATPAQFENYLKTLYKSSADLISRFPSGL